MYVRKRSTRNYYCERLLVTVVPPSIRRCCRASRTVSYANDVLRFNFLHVFYEFQCMLGFVIRSRIDTANPNGAYVWVNFCRNRNPFDVSIETLFRNSLFRCILPKAHKLRKLCFDIDLLLLLLFFFRDRRPW
jgi:hypothetical protein